MSTLERVLAVVERDYNIWTGGDRANMTSRDKLETVLLGLAMDWADESFLDIVGEFVTKTREELEENRA